MLLVDYFLKEIETYKKGQVRQVTYNKYCSNGRFLIKNFPDLVLSKMTADDYQQVLNKYAETHEKATTTDFHHQLAWALKRAYNIDGILKRDVTFDAKIPLGKKPSKKKQKFMEIEDMKKYVDSRVLEITCGEAPFLVSRYDTVTGEPIPLENRAGLLDRKMKLVNENVHVKEEWIEWAIRAFEASYGYEYQGDNLLIARINLLLTFIDYYKDRWEEEPGKRLLRRIANKIVWNIWQMDGLKNTIPLEESKCRIRDWRKHKTVVFMEEQ